MRSFYRHEWGGRAPVVGVSEEHHRHSARSELGEKIVAPDGAKRAASARPSWRRARNP